MAVEVVVLGSSLHISEMPCMSGGGTQPHHPDPVQPKKPPKKDKKKKK